MPICYIVGAGACDETLCPQAGDFLIAADGGAAHIARMGLVPDLLLGDLDSIRGPLPSCPLEKHPKEKDDTDMALAIEAGVRRGYTEFLLFGMLGGERLDHTLSAVLLLPGYAARGLSVTLVGGGQRVRALPGGAELRLFGLRGYLSLFAMGEGVRGLSARGVKYPLSDAVLPPFTSLGVSNEFLPGEEACISSSHGDLLLVWQEEWREEKE